jgi:hypothetical protein
VNKIILHARSETAILACAKCPKNWIEYVVFRRKCSANKTVTSLNLTY